MSRTLFFTVWAIVSVCLLVTSVSPASAAEPSPGSLVVTEILVLPGSDASFPHGQWLEIHNLTAGPVHLGGLTLRLVDQPERAMTIPLLGAPVIAADDYWVAGASIAFAFNGSVPVDYAWGLDFELPVDNGSLEIVYQEQILDQVAWGQSFGVQPPPGVSAQLEPDAQTPGLNDIPHFWCPSTGTLPNSNVLGSPGTPGHACDSDQDGISEDDGDCNDSDPSISPGVTEKCNGVDDNCNGETDEEPLSQPPQWNATGVCSQGGPFCDGANGWDFDLPQGFEPDETSCDGLDNDCDGETDEGLLNSCGDCGEAPQDICDGEDNDCDGDTDEDPGEPPVLPECPVGTVGLCDEVQVVCAGDWKCAYPVGYEEDETLCDRVDNDCDGDTDEGYPVGLPCVDGEGLCQTEGMFVCAPSRTDVVCSAEASTGTVELCGDNIDNDCDGETDEGFPVGTPCFLGEGACRQIGKYFCAPDGLSVTCSAQPLDPEIEVCGNQLDDDCDGDTDEPACDTTPGATGGCSHGNSSTPFLTLLALLAMAGLRRNGMDSGKEERIGSQG